VVDWRNTATVVTVIIGTKVMPHHSLDEIVESGNSDPVTVEESHGPLWIFSCHTVDDSRAVKKPIRQCHGALLKSSLLKDGEEGCLHRSRTPEAVTEGLGFQ